MKSTGRVISGALTSAATFLFCSFRFFLYLHVCNHDIPKRRRPNGKRIERNNNYLSCRDISPFLLRIIIKSTPSPQTAIFCPLPNVVIDLYLIRFVCKKWKLWKKKEENGCCRWKWRGKPAVARRQRGGIKYQKRKKREEEENGGRRRKKRRARKGRWRCFFFSPFPLPIRRFYSTFSSSTWLRTTIPPFFQWKSHTQTSGAHCCIPQCGFKLEAEPLQTPLRPDPHN